MARRQKIKCVGKHGNQYTLHLDLFADGSVGFRASTWAPNRALLIPRAHLSDFIDALVEYEDYEPSVAPSGNQVTGTTWTNPRQACRDRRSQSQRDSAERAALAGDRADALGLTGTAPGVNPFEVDR